MTTRDELIVKFTADVAEFNRRIGDVEGKIDKFTKKTQQQTDTIAGSFKKIGTAVGISLGLREVVQFTGRVINLAGQMQDLANRTGISASAIARLNYVAIDAGVSLNTIASAVQKLQLNLGTGNKKTGNILQALGIDADTLKKQSPEQQFLIIIKALEKVEDRNIRAATSQGLFGRSYREIEQIIAEGSGKIEEALKKSVPSDEQIKQLDDFKDEWDKLILSLEHGAVPILTKVLNIINGVTTALSAENISKSPINKALEDFYGVKRPKAVEMSVTPFLTQETGKFQVEPDLKKLEDATKSNKEQEKKVTKAEKERKILEDRAEAIKENTSATYALSKAEAEIEKLRKEGLLTAEEQSAAVQKLNDDYWDLQRTVADDLTDAINRPIRSFDDLREVALDVLQKIAIQALITGLQLDKMQSGFGGKSATSGIGSVIGSGIRSFLGFAEGGEPPLNRPSIVGERGAELFVPKVAGTIIPNKDLGGGGGSTVYQITQNLNLSTGVVDTVRTEVVRMMPLIAKNTQEAIIAANKRGGAMSITMNNRS